MKLRRLSHFCPFVLMMALLAGCAGSKKAAGPSEPVTVRNIEAAGDGFVYYNLRDNTIVADADEDADTWDVAFGGTTIKINGEGQYLEQPFDAVMEAPKDGYVAGDALPSGSGNGWYVYDPNVHAINPLPEKTLVLKTHDGAYAKIEILSYYLGGPEMPLSDQPRFYTFRFAGFGF